MIDKIVSTILGILFIGFTYWFFLMKKEKAIAVKDSVDILVEGGYNPSTISVSRGKKIKLHFYRKDPSPCLEDVVIPDFKVRKQLPLHKTTTIEITPEKKGIFTISCGMNMFHGKIIVQ